MAIRTGEVLVGTDEVAARLGDPDRRLLEVDEDTEAYGRGHIPGALAVHWRHDLQDPVRREVIGPEAFAALMDRLGVGNDTPVVLYGGNNNWFAAYAYWYFKLYGHQDVKLLDGGRKKWELDSRELTDDTTTREPTTYTAQDPDNSIRAFRTWYAGCGHGLCERACRPAGAPSSSVDRRSWALPSHRCSWRATPPSSSAIPPRGTWPARRAP